MPIEKMTKEASTPVRQVKNFVISVSPHQGMRLARVARAKYKRIRKTARLMKA
jgi:hypothetical protein